MPMRPSQRAAEEERVRALVRDPAREFCKALLTLWDLAGGECEHGIGFTSDCPYAERGEHIESEGRECVFNQVRPALRAADARMRLLR